MRPTSLLEQRRLRKSFRGFPIFENGAVVGVVAEPEINVDDLPVGDQEELGKLVLAALHERDTRLLEGKPVPSEEQTYAMILDDHGIRCPHPVPMRSTSRREGFECRACGSLIVPLPAVKW